MPGELQGFNQPMPGADLYPRQAVPLLTEALTDSPAVLIHGPRQCGKTTLARMVAEPPGYRYFTFDEAVARATSRRRAAWYRDYLTLLARVFLLEELSPWHSDRLSRQIKIPKLHLGDAGTACALLGVDAKALGADRQLLGQLLETFVFQELRR